MPIENEGNWQSFFQGSFLTAQNGIWAGKIEPIVTPEILNKQIIRISASSIDAHLKPWWRTSGYLIQEIGLSMESNRQWKIPLNKRKTIISINEFNDKYKLRFDAVRWLSNLYLEIDTYEG